MDSPVQELSQPETVPMLGPPSTDGRSCAGQDVRGDRDGNSGRFDLAPATLPRPCSSIYSVDSLPLQVTADESIQTPHLSAAVCMDDLGPVLQPPVARPSSSIYSKTSLTIPIFWQPSGARPPSSIYSAESLSWDELTARVEESVKASQLETIERLTQEREALQDKLLLYRRSWHEFTRLFGKLLKLTLRLRDIIGVYDGEITATEEAWVAGWGIEWI